MVKDANFYFQDYGISFPSRLKADKHTQIQLFKDALIDMGKGALYKVDNLTYRKKPSSGPFIHWKKDF